MENKIDTYIVNIKGEWPEQRKGNTDLIRAIRSFEVTGTLQDLSEYITRESKVHGQKVIGYQRKNDIMVIISRTVINDHPDGLYHINWISEKKITSLTWDSMLDWVPENDRARVVRAFRHFDSTHLLVDRDHFLSLFDQQKK